MGYDIRLVMALPCRGYELMWRAIEKNLFQYLLDAADSVIYVSEICSEDCAEKRNYYMVEQSEYCICALIDERSGTGKTVRYARKKRRRVINVAR